MCLDAGCTAGIDQWTLRTWREGDRLEPYGMKGSRLVSDIFNDAKIGASVRSQLPLLFADGKLLWVVGLRASRHFPVTATTERILCLHYPSAIDKFLL